MLQINHFLMKRHERGIHPEYNGKKLKNVLRVYKMHMSICIVECNLFSKTTAIFNFVLTASGRFFKFLLLLISDPIALNFMQIRQLSLLSFMSLIDKSAVFSRSQAPRKSISTKISSAGPTGSGGYVLVGAKVSHKFMKKITEGSNRFFDRLSKN